MDDERPPTVWEWGCFLVWGAVGCFVGYAVFCEIERVIKNAGDALTW